MKREDFEWYLDDDKGGKFIIREHGRNQKVIASKLTREQAGALLIVHNINVKIMWDHLTGTITELMK